MDAGEPPTAATWVGLAGVFTLGLLAWLVPLAALVFTYFLAMSGEKIAARGFMAVAAIAALVALGGPLGIMVWRRWYRAAIAYAAGMVIGVGPLMGLVAWFIAIMGK